MVAEFLWDELTGSQFTSFYLYSMSTNNIEICRGVSLSAPSYLTRFLIHEVERNGFVHLHSRHQYSVGLGVEFLAT